MDRNVDVYSTTSAKSCYRVLEPGWYALNEILTFCTPLNITIFPPLFGILSVTPSSLWICWVPAVITRQSCGNSCAIFPEKYRKALSSLIFLLLMLLLLLFLLMLLTLLLMMLLTLLFLLLLWGVQKKSVSRQFSRLPTMDIFLE